MKSLFKIFLALIPATTLLATEVTVAVTGGTPTNLVSVPNLTAVITFANTSTNTAVLHLYDSSHINYAGVINTNFAKHGATNYVTTGYSYVTESYGLVTNLYLNPAFPGQGMTNPYVVTNITYALTVTTNTVAAGTNELTRAFATTAPGSMSTTKLVGRTFVKGTTLWSTTDGAVTVTYVPIN